MDTMKDIYTYVLVSGEVTGCKKRVKPSEAYDRPQREERHKRLKDSTPHVKNLNRPPILYISR